MTVLLRVVNGTRDSVVGSRIRLADNMVARMRGFLLQREPREGEGLLLSPCRGVHMFGMRYPLDVLFLDYEGEVVALHPDLQPWQRTPIYRRASFALELPVGSIEATGTLPGDRMFWGANAAEETNGRDHGHNGRGA